MLPKAHHTQTPRESPAINQLKKLPVQRTTEVGLLMGELSIRLSSPTSHGLGGHKQPVKGGVTHSRRVQLKVPSGRGSKEPRKVPVREKVST